MRLCPDRAQIAPRSGRDGQRPDRAWAAPESCGPARSRVHATPVGAAAAPRPLTPPAAPSPAPLSRAGPRRGTVARGDAAGERGGAAARADEDARSGARGRGGRARGGGGVGIGLGGAQPRPRLCSMKARDPERAVEVGAGVGCMGGAAVAAGGATDDRRTPRQHARAPRPRTRRRGPNHHTPSTDRSPTRNPFQTPNRSKLFESFESEFQPAGGAGHP